MRKLSSSLSASLILFASIILLSCTKKAEPVLPDKSYISYENQILTVRNKDFKLVKHFDAYQLFNIPNDPGEEHDVILEHPEMADMLKSELKQWYEEILASESSYTHPRFLIGEEGVPETYIYTCATASATGNVKGGSHRRIKHRRQQD